MSTCTLCATPMSTDDAFCPECGTRAGDGAPALSTLGGLATVGQESTLGRRREGAVLAPGTRFAGRYVIEGKLGSGGMGVVYRAQDEVTDRPVALKLIRPERVDGEGEVERLVAEGVTARDIRHPNVVAVYDVGVAEGQPFLSMELLEGQSLRTWHRAQRAVTRDVPYAVTACIVSEILAGLQAAHAAGVIHRDLKPENVILLAEPTSEGAPLKILDFGIARALGTSPGTGSGTGLGTPHYMAPEQITNPDLAGPPADLYSLSVLFYELLVDVLPQGHWQPPSGGRSDVPRAIDALIERGLSNRPASRPATARAYREALESARSASVLDDLRGRWSPRTGLFKQRRTLWIVGAALLVLAAIGGLLPDEDGSIWNDEPTSPDDSVVGHEVPRRDPKEPAQVSLVELSGVWFDGYGGAYDVQVTRSGRVTGSGSSMDGFPLRLEGRIRGQQLSYSLHSPVGQQLGEGGGSWDGGEHFSYQTRAIDGGRLEGVFHINHDPEEMYR